MTPRIDVTYFDHTDASNGMLCEVLAGFAGRAIFCRHCGKCHDAPTTVEIGAWHDGHHIRSVTLCAKCADALLPDLPALDGVTYELIDGRRLEWM